MSAESDETGRQPVELARVPVGRVVVDTVTSAEDAVAVEEPLEIRLGFDEDGKRIAKTISITMRTPGHDFELACGFLFSEAILRDPGDIESIYHCGKPSAPGLPPNVVRVDMQHGVAVDYKRLERHFYMSSSCGVCGKASIEALRIDPTYAPGSGPTVRPSLIDGLPAKLREAQSVFESTGGLHAAALFDQTGTRLAVREDVGRHNAVDKLIGWAFREGRLPLRDHIVMVSGRASFELVQKATMAGVPILAAVSAPSSLAIDLAHSNNMTLLGFVRDGRFNIYSGNSRIDVS